MRILFATLFMSLCLVAPLSAEDIDDHPGFKLVVAQLKAHQRNSNRGSDHHKVV